MFRLSGVNYEEVLQQGDSILVRVIASSSYRDCTVSTKGPESREFQLNLPNNAHRQSFLQIKSEQMSSLSKRSVLSLWTCNIIKWLSLLADVVDLK